MMKAKTSWKGMKNYRTKLKIFTSENDNSDDYNENYIKIKLNTDNDLPLKKH